MALLAASLGNSRLSLALFEGGKITRFGSQALGRGGDFVAVFLGDSDIEGVAYCSTNPPAEAELEQSLPGQAFKIGRDLEVKGKILLRKPEEVGVDRLVVAHEAYARVRRSCLVLDMGTAITLNAVGPEGEFLGGAIAPGASLMARALSDGTAKLPQIEVEERDGILGKDTEQAIQAGIHHGVRGLVRTWIEEGRREMGKDTPVFLTGGDYDRVLGLPGIDYSIPTLLLEGIHRIFAASRES